MCFPNASTWAFVHQKADVADKRSTKFLGKPDENPFGSTDVAEPVYVLIVDDFTYEFCAARADPFQSVIDVVYGEHGAEIAQRVYRGVSVVRNDGRPEEA